VLNIPTTFMRVWNLSGSKSVQLLTVSPNHPCNKRELLYQTKPNILEQHGIGWNRHMEDVRVWRGRVS
jgi:hypothetical protein